MRALKRQIIARIYNHRRVTTQAREGIETLRVILSANSAIVTTQAREGIETTLISALNPTAKGNNSSP